MTTSIHILIIEDNPGDMLLLRHYLENTGLQIDKLYEASSLADAAPILSSEKVDIILLDLFLPDSDGVNTFSQVTKAAPGIPIAVLSGLSDSKVAIKTIQLGAQDYIVKGDYDERILAKVIKYSLERNSIIQKLKQINERYDLMAKATSDVVWDWNIKNDTNWFSDNFEVMFGYSRTDDDSLKASWHDRIHPNDRARVLTGIQKAIDEGMKHWQDEYRFLKADGTYAFIYDRGYTLYTDNGEPYRMIGAMQDITQLKTLQEKFIKQQITNQRQITEAAIRSQEVEKEELGKELHDNINQLLATCKMMIDISLKNKDMREELLGKSFSYLTDAIEEIRKLSKSLVPPALGDIGLGEAIQELVDTVSLTSNTKICFSAQDINNFPINNNIQLMIYRIVQEQINNILKYARASEASIKIFQADNRIKLIISDNGVGFDVKQKRSGIGLRNIKSRAQLYGGSVRIDSSLGNGCTLKIGIPLKNNMNYEENIRYDH